MCNSFRRSSQLYRETADFGESHVLSHLQNMVSGIALILRTQKNFRVTCILWKAWHPSPARLCRPSPLTQGDLKQALTFPLSFSITLATKHFLFGLRFPNQNQTRNCWQNYVDFHRCQKLKVCRLMKRFTAS